MNEGAARWCGSHQLLRSQRSGGQIYVSDDGPAIPTMLKLIKGSDKPEGDQPFTA
jgi:hypothetical protein